MPESEHRKETDDESGMRMSSYQYTCKECGAYLDFETHDEACSRHTDESED